MLKIHLILFLKIMFQGLLLMEIENLFTFILRNAGGKIKAHFPTKCDTIYSPPQGKEHERFSFSDWVHVHPFIYAATILYLNVNHLQNATANFSVAYLHSMHVHYVLYG